MSNGKGKDIDSQINEKVTPIVYFTISLICGLGTVCFSILGYIITLETIFICIESAFYCYWEVKNLILSGNLDVILGPCRYARR